MGRILIYAIPIVITLYALIDALMTPDAQARRLPKLLWLLVIVVIPFAGAVAWLLLGRPRTEPYDRGSGGGGGGGSDRPPAPGCRVPGRRRGPLAPDDDPEFLRELQRAAWRQRMRQRRASGSDDKST